MAFQAKFETKKEAFKDIYRKNAKVELDSISSTKIAICPWISLSANPATELLASCDTRKKIFYVLKKSCTPITQPRE